MNQQEQERQNTDIAIIGMACRFPGANDWRALWENLKNGIDSVTDIPDGRWPAEEEWYHPDPAQVNRAYIRCGGFLDRVDQFDAPFFNISPLETKLMDPQQRIFLEEAYHAIEDAGLAPEQLKGQNCGIFVGVGQSGYTLTLYDAGALESRYAITGLDSSTLAARIAYFLDLQGPAIALNTACSSSLLAAHKACESIRSGEIDLALVGGVTLYLTPLFHIQASEFQMLSPAGRCKTFDADAKGFVPSEGCGVLLLKNAAKAMADGDNIHAIIKGSGINQDGSTNGITAPSARAQYRLEKSVYENYGIDPATIGYVEAHGTGTALGDPIEVTALTDVFAEYTDQKQFCAIGSIKTNLGHTVQAAGVAGLIKAALCLKYAELVPSLHFDQPNPHIDFRDSPFYVSTSHQAWEAPMGHPRRAAVSAFGISGTNAHMVLESAPQETETETGSGNRVERPVHLLTLSTKNAEGLFDYARRYHEFLSAHPDLDLGDLCHTSYVGRSHFAHRLGIVADSAAGLKERLAAYMVGEKDRSLHHGSLAPGRLAPKIAFLFTGQGAQYVEMGRELYDTSPTFRVAIERCDALLQESLGESLLKILYPKQEDEGTSLIDQTAYTQPALFALEYALATLWRSWGIQPDILMGHSIGELVAACVAGVFGLEEGLRLVAARGRLMGALPQDGEMVSLLADEARVREAIEPVRQGVSIAAVNGPQSVVISGQQKAVREIAAQLAAEGIKTRQLTVSHAFHSPLMTPMLDEFRQIAASIAYHRPTLPLVSNVTGQLAGDEIATPDYWVRHVRDAVRFGDGVATLCQQGIDVFLEIGPKPILIGMASQTLDLVQGVSGEESSGPRPVTISSLREKRSDWRQMLTSLSELYVQGVEIDWRGVDRDTSRRKLSLPTYPFQRERYWIANGKYRQRVNQAENNMTTSRTNENPLDPAQPTGVQPTMPDLSASLQGVQQALPQDISEITLQIDELKGFRFSIKLGGEESSGNGASVVLTSGENGQIERPSPAQIPDEPATGPTLKRTLTPLSPTTSSAPLVAPTTARSVSTPQEAIAVQTNGSQKAAGEMAGETTASPISEIEDPTLALKQILADILYIDDVHSINEFDKLTDQGMDSVTGVEFINIINSTFGLALKAVLIYDYPTIKDLSAYIHSALTQQGTASAPSQQAELSPPEAGAVLDPEQAQLREILQKVSKGELSAADSKTQIAQIKANQSDGASLALAPTKQDQVWQLVQEQMIEILPDLAEETIKPTDTFDDLGFDSMEQAEVIVQTLEILGLDTPRIEFAQAKNVGELATQIASKSEQAQA